MKTIKLILILSSIILSGCALVGKDELGLDTNKTVKEENYRKTPCTWDGTTL
jgi:hypothetical protein